MKTSLEPEKPKSSSALKVALVAAGIVLSLWAANWFLLLTPLSFEVRGQFGDMFGFSNSLFSGLALVGVIYAIFVQREEMAIARAELHYTKEILSEQKEQLKIENEATKTQSFENTYFKLLELFAGLTSNLDLERSADGGNPIRGKDVFTVFEKDLNRHENGLKQELGRQPTFREVYDRLYRDRNRELGHYFRLMYNIVKFVDGSDEANKRFYTNILRAQLSDAELMFLMYNGLSGRGGKFKPLIEKYALLDNLPIDRVKYPAALDDYSAAAFGKNEESRLA